ncbi:MAG: hypothetical protein LC800_17255 [Acidobacteria bacterium]|nr:hypothetical protein [Acidobacteriota bacterium]
MKRLLISFIAATAIGLAAPDIPGQAGTSVHAARQPAQQQQPQPPQTPEASEAARLSRSVVELHRAGKYADALPLAERALAISS